MRNGDRNKGELGRGDQAMESLGTGGERGKNGGERGNRLERGVMRKKHIFCSLQQKTRLIEKDYCIKLLFTH